MRTPARAILFVLVMVLGVACAQTSVIRNGVPVPVDMAADSDLRAAKAALAVDDPARAREILEQFLLDLGRSRRADEARFLLGELYLKADEAERAALVWTQLVDRSPYSKFAPDARLRAARIYRDLGEPERGRRLLAGANFARAPEAQRAAMHRLMADLSRATGDYADAAVGLAFALRYTEEPSERDDIDLELRELIEDRLSTEDLIEVSDRIPRGRIYDRVVLELTDRYIGLGQPERAQAELKKLPQTLAESEEQTRAYLSGLVGEVGPFDVYPVGVAVPLSGDYAAFGTSVLRGLVLGLGVFDETPGSYKVVVRDTAGDPVRAEEATRELIEARSRFIIGPMRSVSAEAVAPQVAERGIPMLSLARSERVVEAGPSIFRLGVAPKDQVKALVDFAVNAMEARRFAVLYPRDSYGTEYKNLFWEEVERQGGEVVGVEGYAPDAVDVQTQIRKLVGLHYIGAEEAALIAERDRLARRREQNEERLLSPELAELPPYVDFDALFIPEAAEKVGVILPQLRFYDISDVTLLGPSDWNDPKLAELAGREATDAIFVDTFYAGSRDPGVAEFVRRYVEAYGEEPDAYAADAFDAGKLLRSMIEGGAVTPADLRLSMLSLPASRPDFDAVAGLTSFSDTGDPIKQLYLLTVSRREIREFDPDRMIKFKTR